MFNLYRAKRATTLSAIWLGLGLLACVGYAKASGREIASLQIARAAPFEAPWTAPDFQSSEPFGLEASAVVHNGMEAKWNSVRIRLPDESRILMRCRIDLSTCPAAARRFLAIVDKARTRDGLARIGEINRAINLDIRPIDDMTHYGVKGVWSTPLFTFAEGAGDCKDYAIAKYVALREMGFADDDLRLVVVHDRATNEDHAVAAVRYVGRWLILDNRSLDMRQDIDIAEFNPLFVIDGVGVKRLTTSATRPPSFEADVMPPRWSAVTLGQDMLLF
jgi:predicted transglutaminase-like cysteine proteinase